ncbi:MAG: hypothetical protein KatS3mg088_348 [Patescibacteria group bacterium]|nr:MAG: hypothetical protein KatS3mg088_348 [Patescibacteria group bacterium]
MERKTLNPLIGVIFILCLVAIFSLSNWQELVGTTPPTPVTNSNTVADTEEEIVVPNTGANIIDSIIKILILKWGFETALFVVSITAAVLTIVLLAKLGIEGKYVVRGGVVIGTMAGYYVATFNPISYLFVLPASILLILAAFSFSFSSGERIEISSDGGRKESRYIRTGFKD